jgi:glutathione S-transferase
MRIWGRANSVNVQKVLWGCAELGVEYERIDAGMRFGRVDDPDYRAINPNGRVPTLVDGDFVLWESNSILRYLAMKHGNGGALYPEEPARRASIDRWLDWQLSTLQPAERALFWGMVRTPPERRNMAEIAEAAKASGVQWGILDARLGDGRKFVEGDDLTLADIVLGAYARRWFGVEVADRPSLPRLDGWYARLQERPGFQRYVAPPLT